MKPNQTMSLLQVVFVYATVTFVLAHQEIIFDEDILQPFTGAKFDQFDWKLCQVINTRHASNELLSPVSLKLILAVLHEGAIGQTAKEIEDVMEVQGGRTGLRLKFNSVLQSLGKDDKSSQVEIGTKVYLNYTMTPKNWFRRILDLYFDTEIERVDFTRIKETTDQINKWVEKLTRGNIRQLIGQDEKLANNVVLMINAMYFKGKWEQSFDKANTKVGKFLTMDKQYVDAQYMTNKGLYYYSEPDDIDVKIIRLPYQGNKYAMYLVIPTEPTALHKISQILTPTLLRKQIWLLEETKVKLTMPKFQFVFSVHLKDVLQEMGIKQMFEDGADFRGITKSKKDSLVVSNVIQKTGIAVDEEGSEAYAATEVELVNRISEQEVRLDVTHPFMFYIEDEPTGTVMFVGKVLDPSVSQVEVTPTEKLKPTTTTEPARRNNDKNWNRSNSQTVRKQYGSTSRQ